LSSDSQAGGEVRYPDALHTQFVAELRQYGGDAGAFLLRHMSIHII
jgi:hypothetical protein